MSKCVWKDVDVSCQLIDFADVTIVFCRNFRVFLDSFDNLWSAEDIIHRILDNICLFVAVVLQLQVIPKTKTNRKLAIRAVIMAVFAMEIGVGKSSMMAKFFNGLFWLINYMIRLLCKPKSVE